MPQNSVENIIPQESVVDVKRFGFHQLWGHNPEMNDIFIRKL